MNKENKKLVVEGNALYEIDMECLRRRRGRRRPADNRTGTEKDQKNRPGK